MAVVLLCVATDARAEERPIAWGEPRDGIACGIATDRDRYELGERVFLAVFVRNTRPKAVRYGILPITTWRKTADGGTEMDLQTDARYDRGALRIVPPGEVRRVLVQDFPTRPSPNPLSGLHFTPGKTSIAVSAPRLADRQDGPTRLGAPGGDRSGVVTIEVVVPAESAAARLACADLGTNSARIVYAAEDRESHALYVIDPTPETEQLVVPLRWRMAREGAIPKGTRQVIGRLPMGAHEVREFKQAGLSLHLVLRRIVGLSDPKSQAWPVYLVADLPPLGPGRYELRIDFEDAHRGSDGRDVPVTNLHRQNTMPPWFFTFDVPAPPSPPKAPPGPALPGSACSLEDALRALAFAAVCEATSEPRPEGASLTPGLAHPTQAFRIVEPLVGGAKGQELEWSYPCFWQRERQLAKGERLIWIVRNDGSWRGVKALPDTPENRKAVLATAQALGTKGGSADLRRAYHGFFLARQDDATPGICGIAEEPRNPSMGWPELYREALAGRLAPGGGTFLVRLAGARVAGPGLQVVELKRIGSRIELLARHYADLRQDETEGVCYFFARFPRDFLPPGRYTVHVAVQDWLARGWGGYEPAPAGLPPHFRPLTGEITVPARPAGAAGSEGPHR